MCVCVCVCVCQFMYYFSEKPNDQGKKDFEMIFHRVRNDVRERLLGKKQPVPAYVIALRHQIIQEIAV